MKLVASIIALSLASVTSSTASPLDRLLGAPAPAPIDQNIMREAIAEGVETEVETLENDLKLMPEAMLNVVEKQQEMLESKEKEVVVATKKLEAKMEKKELVAEAAAKKGGNLRGAKSDEAEEEEEAEQLKMKELLNTLPTDVVVEAKMAKDLQPCYEVVREICYEVNKNLAAMALKICFNAEKGKCVAITEKVAGVTELLKDPAYSEALLSRFDGLSERDKFKELLKDPTYV